MEPGGGAKDWRPSRIQQEEAARCPRRDRAREESALVYGPRAGVKLFLVDNVALDVEVTYKMGAADVFIHDFQPEDTDLSTGIGLRVLF